MSGELRGTWRGWLGLDQATAAKLKGWAEELHAQVLDDQDLEDDRRGALLDVLDDVGTMHGSGMPAGR